MYNKLLSSLEDYSPLSTDMSGLEGFLQPDINQNRLSVQLGLENLDNGDMRSKYLQYKTTMNESDQMVQKEAHLHVHTLDNRYYRIYISPNNLMDSNTFQNKFCTFLDGLVEGQVVRILFGASLNGWWNDISLGPLISSMRNCRAKVITSIIGRCGCPETYLWMFGHERTFSDYGEIQFTGIQKILKQFPVYKDYFDYIFSRAVMLRVITEEQKTVLMTTNTSIFWNKSVQSAQ